jgi:hypothetical protein
MRASGQGPNPAVFGHDRGLLSIPDSDGSSIPPLVDDDAGEFPLSGREHHE